MSAAQRSDGGIRVAGKLALAIIALSVGTSACSSPAVVPPGSTSASTPHLVANPCPGPPESAKGGTLHVGEVVQYPPDFIFPLMPLQHYVPENIGEFQQLMYRPLYWLGQPVGDQVEPSLNRCLSLALPPTFSSGGRVVTIKLDSYRWSDGERVSAQDVMFWMNLLKTETVNWAGYLAGEMPDNVADVVATGPSTVRFTFTKAFDPTWVLYNQLSQVTPLPMAWDVVKPGAPPGSGGCASAAYASITIGSAPAHKPSSHSARACDAVYTFLARQAGYDPTDPQGANGKLGTYATNPLWQVVDGPWRLQRFSEDGEATFVPNATFSGPAKPVLSELVEVPFGDYKSELSALAAGKIQVALGLQAVSQPPAPLPRHVGYIKDYTWGVNFISYGFGSIGDGGEAGAIFRQLYIRQSMQDVVDQPALINQIYDGAAAEVDGPVPLLPHNAFVDRVEESNPYPYDPPAALSLLRQHGWKVVPGGISTCAEPALCGTGISRGAQLSFDLTTVSFGTEYEVDRALAASWAKLGIAVHVVTFDCGILGCDLPCSHGSPCRWELLDLNGGWDYIPDYEPTAEQFLLPGPADTGGYQDPTASRDIEATVLATPGAFQRYEDYVSQQLPVIWVPTPVTLTGVAPGVGGVLPEGPGASITPEYWYLTA